MTHFTGDFTQLRVLLALVKALHDNEKKSLIKMFSIKTCLGGVLIKMKVWIDFTGFRHV